MSSMLVVAMVMLISVFHTYSAPEGDKHKLNRREMKDLLQNELGEYLESVRILNQNSSEMSSQLEGAMESLISVFHTYSVREFDKHKLSQKEQMILLQEQLMGYMKTQKDAGTVDKIMKELDENGDEQVDFKEFVILVASLTKACNTVLCESS